MEIAPVTEESGNPPCHRARGVVSRSFEREIANRIRRERRERPLQFLGVLGCVGLGLGIVTRIRRSSRG